MEGFGKFVSIERLFYVYLKKVRIRNSTVESYYLSRWIDEFVEKELRCRANCSKIDFSPGCAEGRRFSFLIKILIFAKIESNYSLAIQLEKTRHK